MINRYKLKLTRLQHEILELLFVKAGKAMNQRGIARMLGVSAPAVMKAVPGLSKKGFVKAVKDESGRWAVELNRDDYKVMHLKRADNLKQIYTSGLADFLEKEFAGSAIVLFGSYSRGEDTISSDIDIAVIGRKEKRADTSTYSKVLEREIRINFYDSVKGIHKNLKENIFNGIVIGGSIEL